MEQDYAGGVLFNMPHKPGRARDLIQMRIRYKLWSLGVLAIGSVFFEALESDGSCVLFDSGLLCQRCVQFGSACFLPADAGAVIAERSLEIGDDHVVVGLPCLGEGSAVAV